MSIHPSKSVFISGSSRGIGRACALCLAGHGYDIVLHGKSPSQALEQTLADVKAMGVNVRALTFDVCDREASRQALLKDIEEHGMYWGIVANAGISRDVTFAGMESQAWDTVLETNLQGFYNVVQPLVMPMVHTRRGGRIVVIASISGVMGNRGQVNYSAAKAGLIGAAKALALELASRKITVNAVAPGLIETDMVDESVTERALPFIPMKRVGKPEEVAATVGFLISDDAAYITRSVIEIDGGLHG
ncbi:3-oxoacyl-ACP reductase FabG [Parasutterella secunda]|uniref:3-oxoacyl-ACP reductase FabG n=1 Tax=Parasutterella secunda TaxID=626947 RepID=UPI0025A3FE41|nr:3-oxoacyl-ACP reductase FabG [Parasutterella secunda]MDM8086754.1 3-oxoacyl-ACP reductase FabG [Parasutterella secunda]